MPSEQQLVNEWMMPGASYATVAKNHGISPYRVANAVRKAFPNTDLARMKVYNNPNRVTDEAIADAYRKTPMSYEKLGTELGVSAYRVCQAVTAVISSEERRAIRHKVQKSLVTNNRAKKIRAAEIEQNEEPRKIIVGPIPIRGSEHYVLKSPRAGESLTKFAYRVDRYGFYTERVYQDKEDAK